MQIEEVFNRLEDKKKQLRDRKERMKDELKNHTRYMEIEEEIATLKRERKEIEMSAITQADKEEIEGIKLDIRTDKELLTDLTLNKYVAGESCEIIDDHRRPHQPVFSVKYAKV